MEKKLGFQEQELLTLKLQGDELGPLMIQTVGHDSVTDESCEGFAGRGVLECFQNKSITSTIKQLCEITTLFKLIVSEPVEVRPELLIREV